MDKTNGTEILNNSILNKIKSSKFLQYLLVIVLLIVAAFILFGGEMGKKNTESNSFSQSYVTDLEFRLENTLSKVEGAGKVSVVITVESGMESVLAMETVTKESSAGKETIETPIIVNGKTVTLKEMYPKITGVLIVAEGANKIGVLNRIQQATTSLLDINVNQIEILTMK